MIRHILVDITERCNYTCKHCYKPPTGAGTELSSDLFLAFLRGNPLVSQCGDITLSGGEPLLYGQLRQLLEGLTAYRVKIDTNGFFLDRDIESLRRFGNLKVAVSLDGYDVETYRQVRNNAFFDRICENISLAVRGGLDVIIQTRITKCTQGRYEAFIDLAQCLGAPILLSPMVYSGRAEQRALVLSHGDLREWLQDMKRKRLMAYTNLDKIIERQSCALYRNKGVPLSLVVDSGGRLFPCTAFRDDDFVIGTLKDFDEAAFRARCEAVNDRFRAKLEDARCQACGARKAFGDGTCLVGCAITQRDCAFDLT